MIAEVRDLYAVAPGEFTAERNRLAKALKAEGRTDDAAVVGRLRRPRLSEHALNLLARAEPETVRRLVDAGEAASAAQSAAIGGSGTSLREATAELRAATKSAVDAAVRELSATGANGEAQRDEITELLRTLITSGSSAQLVQGVVGLEGVEVSDELFPGAPEPPESGTRAPARKSPETPLKTPTPARVGGRPAKSAPPTESPRAKHAELATERTRLTKRRREAQQAVDDAERAVAIAVKEADRARRAVAAAEAKLDDARATADKASAALDDFERSLRD